MDKQIGIGAIVGLVVASSFYVYNSDKFTTGQKTILLLLFIFPPIQWFLIIVLLVYKNYKLQNSLERRVEQKRDGSISDLADLKKKGILSDEEYSQKLSKLEVEKSEQDLKNSIEYKQLKNLFDSGLLTRDEFESKIEKLLIVDHLSSKDETQMSDF